jgi:hypothetical protein
MVHPQLFRVDAARVTRAAALLVAIALEAGVANSAALLGLEVESKARDLELGGASDLYEPAPVSATQGPLTDSYAAAVTVLGGMDASAFVRAHADYGLLRAEAIALVGGVSTESSAQAGARVSFADDLVFSGAPAGTQGTAQLILLIDGNASISLTHPADSGALVDEEVRLTALSSFGSFSDLEHVTTPGGYLAGFLEIDVPFVFGEVVQIFGEVNLSASAWADGDDQPGVIMTAGAVSDFWSTARWGGIRNVRDANGNALASWGVSSASGTDYVRAFPVPEPALPALLAAAYAGSLSVRPFRRRTPNRRR